MRWPSMRFAASQWHRLLAACLLAVSLPALEAHAAQASAAPDAPGPDYTESVTIDTTGSDGANAISLSLARYPARNAGAVRLQLVMDGQSWALAEEDLRLRGETAPDDVADATPIPATPVADEAVEFRAGGRADVRFESRMRHSPAMHGEVNATLYAHATDDPAPGPGDVPVRLELTFMADGRGDRSDDGSRWELPGRVRGRVFVGGRVHEIELSGIWVERVGGANDRSRSAESGGTGRKGGSGD